MQQQSTAREIRAIRIVDSNGATSSWGSAEQAERYVAQGRAKWSRTRRSIRMSQGNAAHEAAVLCKLEYDRVVNGGEALTIEKLKRIPFVGNPSLLLGVGRKRRKGVAVAA